MTSKQTLPSVIFKPPPVFDDESGYDEDLEAMRQEQCFGCCFFSWARDVEQ